jgi:hypothetical protein
MIEEMTFSHYNILILTLFKFQWVMLAVKNGQNTYSFSLNLTNNCSWWLNAATRAENPGG